MAYRMEEEKSGYSVSDDERSRLAEIKSGKGISVPAKFDIKQSGENGFALDSCMQNFALNPKETYEKDGDYYFDSYSHFNIHEEMLKDRVNIVLRLALKY